MFYIQPREKIKVRTDWLEGGPQMPSFLSTMEESKASTAENGQGQPSGKKGGGLAVRYALSAFEDLNSAIKNLRRCFGFPYQEYIGYLNTLTRTHRARREHESLLAGLRRWAIFGNVDAVVWIDYAKSNQPPGSFKVGPRDSRPFSAAHMEICTSVHEGSGGADHDGEESDVVWSEIDETEAATTHLQATVVAPGTDLVTTQKIPWSSTEHEGSRQDSKTEGGHGILVGLRTPLRRLRTSRMQPPVSARTRRLKAGTTHSPVGGMFKAALQEEVIPAHGSIYPRSSAPGPGYYGIGSAVPPDAAVGPTFGRRHRHHLDAIAAKSEELPGPGEYRPKTPLAEAKMKFGSFNRAEKLVSPMDTARKLPFISQLAAACEGFGTQSPNAFTSVAPTAACHVNGFSYSPKFSFGKSRRPF